MWRIAMTGIKKPHLQGAESDTHPGVRSYLLSNDKMFFEIEGEIRTEICEIFFLLQEDSVLKSFNYYIRCP